MRLFNCIKFNSIVILIMKNFLIIIILSFFYGNLANAGFEGSGKIKLNETVVKYFKEYLDTKDHNSKSGAERHGRGWFFFVAESGEEFGYVYCPQGKQCVMDQVPARNVCKKNVKKYLNRTEKCYLFASQRIIKWGGQRIQIPGNASSIEIDEILRENGFID